MGISCESWGKVRSIEKKLEYKRMMDSIKKTTAKASEQKTKKAPKEKEIKNK